MNQRGIGVPFPPQGNSPDWLTAAQHDSTRDLFAAHALTMLMKRLAFGNDEQRAYGAQEAFKIADAMMAARAQR